MALRISSVIDLLRAKGETQGEQRGFIFLEEGEREEGALTYSELSLRSRALAAYLQSYNERGERALLLYPQGLEFISAFFGCLAAGVIAVPCPPAGHSRQSVERIASIAGDAQPLFVLTTSAVLAQAKELQAQIPALEKVHWIATDPIGGESAGQWRDMNLRGKNLAFLQYTSGSTAAPKGVMVSHDNILANVMYLDKKIGQSVNADTVNLTWVPTFHDMGMIAGIFRPLCVGFPSYLMSPLAFVKRPLRWLQAITKYRISHSAGPTFAYDLCVHKTTPEERAMLDLSTWQSGTLGAEPIRRQTIEAFVRTFEPCGLNPKTLRTSYGLAEATLLVSASEVGTEKVYRWVDRAALERNDFVEVPEAGGTDERLRELVGVGRPAADQARVVIVDPATLKQCPDDKIGEVWISGPGIAQGYWNRPEETQETFHGRLSGTGEGPFLRTGDLGILRDGELFITGRLKDLIIINGRNHYAQEIERTLESSHPAIRLGCSAAFAVTLDDRECLAVVTEINQSYVPAPDGLDEEGVAKVEGPHSTTSKEIIRAIRGAIAEEHDLNLRFVLLLRAGKILKTSSGKIQRRACRQGFLDGSLNQFSWDPVTASCSVDALALETTGPSTAPRTKVEEALAAIWSKVLGIATVTIHDDFFQLGGDSLQAIQLVTEVNKCFRIELTLRNLITARTIATLAELIEEQLMRGIAELTDAEAEQMLEKESVEYTQ